MKAYRGRRTRATLILTLVIYVVKLDLKERSKLGIHKHRNGNFKFKELNLGKLTGVIFVRLGSVG